MTQQTLSEAIRLRYGDSDQPSEFVWSETLELLLNHRSVRAYRQEPLPHGTLETLVAAAQSASTSSNLQAWSVVAVEDPTRKARLATLAGNQAHIRDCQLFLVWLADLSRLERVANQQNIAHAGLDYTEMFVLAVIDAALAAQNAVVAAEALGLGTVYIGGIRNHPLDVAAELQLPPRVFPVFGMCVGWPDQANPASVKPRLPQEAVLYRETYAHAGEEAAVERYNATMSAFYEEQRMRVDGNWAQHSARRVAGPKALSGRDAIRDTLNKLGFELR
jgi:nitroreductase